MMSEYILVCDPPPNFPIPLQISSGIVHHVHHIFHHHVHHHTHHFCNHVPKYCKLVYVGEDSGGGAGSSEFFMSSYYERLDTIIQLPNFVSKNSTIPEPNTFILIFVGLLVVTLLNKIKYHTSQMRRNVK